MRDDLASRFRAARAAEGRRPVQRRERKKDVEDRGELTTRRTAETIGEWFDANGGYNSQYQPGEWKVRAQQVLWRMSPGLIGGAAGLQWAAVIDTIAPIVEAAFAQRRQEPPA